MSERHASSLLLKGFMIIYVDVAKYSVRWRWQCISTRDHDLLMFLLYNNQIGLLFLIMSWWYHILPTVIQLCWFQLSEVQQKGEFTGVINHCIFAIVLLICRLFHFHSRWLLIPWVPLDSSRTHKKLLWSSSTEFFSLLRDTISAADKVTTRLCFVFWSSRSSSDRWIDYLSKGESSPK